MYIYILHCIAITLNVVFSGKLDLIMCQHLSRDMSEILQNQPPTPLNDTVLPFQSNGQSLFFCRCLVDNHRTPAPLYSYPRKDLPGGISSLTSNIIHSFIILLYTLINNYLYSCKIKSEDIAKQISKKGFTKIISL